VSLRLRKLELREVRIPFRFSFKHALAERREAHSLFVAVETDGGEVGYGEVLPRAYLTGETVDSAWTDIRERWWPGVRSIVFADAALPGERLRETYLEADSARKTASYAGVDVAVHDAWARATRTPGSAMFGVPVRPQRLTCALGGGSGRSVRWLGRLGWWVGFRAFKLKVGGVGDVERLEAARSGIGQGADLRVDANGAWTVEEALNLAEGMRRVGVSSIEQPVAADDVDGMARVQRETGMDVMADESLCTRSDAQMLLRAGAARLWNLRLAKVGGFTGVRELIHIAQEGVIRVHLGVLVGESAVLAAAARACAGLADFVHVEFGFPRILLRDQPFQGDPGGYRGVGRPLRAAAGLGIRPNREVLERLTVRRVELT
jgi:muconate cycloisomerase